MAGKFLLGNSETMGHIGGDVGGHIVNILLFDTPLSTILNSS